MTTKLKAPPIDPTVTEQLNEYCQLWLNLKQAESEANESRVEIERQIIQLTGFVKLEGSQSVKNNDFKISLTAKLDRKLDVAAYLLIESQLPEDMRPVKVKTELDLTGIKWMEKNEPELAKLVTNCVTTKPAKTSVKVEFLGVL